MKNKLIYLTKQSLNKKIGTKWFLIANIVLCLLLIGLTNVDSIIKLFGGDFNEKTEIFVVDNIDSYIELEDTMTKYSDYLGDTNYKMELYSGNIDSKIEELEDNKNQVLVLLNEDSTNFIKAEIISYEGIDNVTYQLLTTSLNDLKKNIALEYYNIDNEKLYSIDKAVEISRIRLDEKKSDETTELLTGVIFPLIMLPFFILTIYLVQMIGAEINEEKTTRGMEIIISNVSPKVHFLSKMLASNLFVIIQGILLIAYTFMGTVVRFFTTSGSILGESTEQFNSIIDNLDLSEFTLNLNIIIPITIIFILTTFIAYSLVAGILASMTTNQEDYQQLQSPIMIVSVIGYYLSAMASMFEGSTFIRIISYLPFISSMLSPSLLILGQISIVDIIISLAILIIFIIVLFKYGMRIYKVGILNYSSNNLWKKMLKAMKK